ncbi:GGDEF domain-containing protein [Bacillaceae bacterium W0354]
MNTRFGFKLFMAMIIFSVTISTVVSISDFLRLREQAIENNQFQIEQIEDTITYSLTTIEKAYHYFDQDTAERMERYTDYIINKYQENPNFDEWDFQSLKETVDQMDIYILNENNVITHSSYVDDIGLDFNACCSKLAKTLDERRESGEFYHDGIDIEQQTGTVKKYSYKSTPDKKYIIELGLNLQGGPIFSEFNFLQVADELVEKYPTVNAINVLNIGGYSLGIPVDDRKLPQKNREAFERTLKTGEVREVEGLWDGLAAKYRYVRYDSNYDQGTTQYKVIELVYDKSSFQSILFEQRKTFYVQLIITLIIASIISLILSRLIARPMHLAFHDSLTGLRNRAAFDEFISAGLSNEKSMSAFFMIDLDNFKLVNDHLGHDEGDYLLQKIAHCIRMAARKKDMTFRYGGDEFILVMENTTKEEIGQTADLLINTIKNVINSKQNLVGLNVSASIGIALSPEHGDDLQVLYKKADIALYASKSKGKNQFQFYSDDLLNHQD